MAAMMMAQAQNQSQSQSSSTQPANAGMPEMNMSQSAVPNGVSFPYGFPSDGGYRIFIQMKHGQTVETGVFDADVRQK